MAPRLGVASPCELLPWDSAFFGFTTARVRGHHLDEARVGAVDSWSKANGVCLLYFEASINDPVTVRLAEGCGFRLVDVRVVMAADLILRSVETPDPTALRPAQEGDLPAMVRMCSESFQDSRFYFDERIPEHLSRALYERWVEESYRGYADRVFLAVTSQRVQGFITCHLHPTDKTSRIGLIAVDERNRGRGVGELLVGGAQAWLAAQGAKSVTVTTQARNIGAQRLYNKRGFRISSSSLYYHKWYDSGDRS